MATGFKVSSSRKENYADISKADDDKRPPSGIRVRKHLCSSSLEMFDSDQDFSNPIQRENSNVKRQGHVPPRPGSNTSVGRSTPSATKQISLQTIKRKTDSQEDILPDLEDEHNEEKEKHLNERLEKLSLGRRSTSSLFKRAPETEPSEPVSSLDGKKIESKEDESSSDEEEEEKKAKAPNELFMEFLTCIMEKDYTTAKKLCLMILMYEPDHAEALGFQNLIDEKILLDEIPDDSEDDEDRESGHELDSEDDDDDDSDESSSDDSSDSSDDDSSAVHTTDSGITSASISD